MPDGDSNERPGSYASLDRRVSSLEITVGEIRGDLRHAGEITDLRLKAIEANTGAVSQGLKALEQLIERAFRDPYAVMPSSAKEERDEWRKWREETDTKLDRYSARESQGQGVKMTLTFTAAFVAALASVVSIAVTVVNATGHR